MESFIKVSGKTVEDAILEASIQLGTTSDNIEFKVIEHETKGFLGLGAKRAVIEAKVKKSDEEYVEEVMSGGKKTRKKTEKTKEKAEKKTVKAAAKADKPEKTDKADKPEKAEKVEKVEKAEKAEKAGKSSKQEKANKADKADKPEKTAVENSVKTEKTETVASEENIPEEKETQTQMPEKDRTPKAAADPQVVKQRAEEFLASMFDAMGMEVNVDMSFEDDTLLIDLSGDDMGVLIGKRGQTLDSIQYLTSLVVNKGKAAYVRVKVDTENYRERRRATLENLAKNIAFKVKKTRKSVYLEPMNPYERRIIHSTLQNDPYVTTHSEGEEPLRKVVVTLKKRDKAPEEEDL